MNAINPYSGQTFFGFFLQLFLRFFGFLKGDWGYENLASDEIQILVLCGIAISSALLGTFLILRKMTMLANALSHTILVGLVIAFVASLNFSSEKSSLIDLKSLLIASFTMGIATTFLTEFLTKSAGLQEDASIGIVFTGLFSIGIILVTLLTRNSHIGTEVVMGNVDFLQISDLKLVLIVLGINLLIFGAFFKEFTITTFDSNLARALGISPLIFNYILMIQVSATCIGAFRAVGVLMVLAFIAGPPLTARILTHNLKTMLAAASCIGCAASIVGVAIARHLLSVHGIALSTGGLVVCMIGVFFSAALLFDSLKFWANRSRLAKQIGEETVS